MKIGSKLILGFLIVSLLIGVDGYLSFVQINNLGGNVGDSADEDIVAVGNTILFFSVVTILLAIGMGIFFSHTISKPIVKLQNATKELEKGHFEVRVDIKTGDELEQLGEVFNRTTDVLEKTDEKIKQLDKAKNEFLTITSHELRIPMTPMKIQLQMLLKGYLGKLNKEQKESIDIVLRNTARLDKNISDFLEISRMESARLKFNFVKADLTKYINQLVKEMKFFMVEKKIKIVPKISKLPLIEVDPDRTMQVLRNLINNAIKFSEKNGKILVNVTRKKDNILFSVIDYGKGISPENKKRIFEPFFQEEDSLHREYGGTGLGLTICRGIVESQNGKMWVESEVGKGSTFCFTLPLKPVRNIQPIKLMFSTRQAVRPETKLDKLKRTAAEKNIKIDYEKFIQELIYIVFRSYGKLAIEKIKNIEGLKVDSKGKVKEMGRDKDEILEKLGLKYLNLIGSFERFISEEKSRNMLLKKNIFRYISVDEEKKQQ